MYAVLRHYTGSAGLIDGLVQRQDGVRKLVSEIDGFRAYYMLDLGNGGAVSVSVYDDRAGAEASVEAARGFISEHLPDLQVAPPEVSAGEVVINA